MKFRVVLILLVGGLFSTVLSQPFRGGLGSANQLVVADSSDDIAAKIVNSPIPVLVDFWAAWCGPCKLLNPIFKKLEKEYKGKVLFMKVNVDYHRRIAGHFQVQGIPAVFIIKDKQVHNALQGLQPEEAYRNALELVLATSDTAAQKSTRTPAKNGPVNNPQQ